MRKDILQQKELILQLIEKKAPKNEICRILNCKTTTLDSYLKKMNIEYSGNKSRKGLQKTENYKNVEAYLFNGSSIQSHKLKLKLIRENIFEHKCHKCGLCEWEGVKIPLELDHIDGQHFNNELSNLRLLCPNCHALTDTYRSKNRRTVRTKKEIESLAEEVFTRFADDIENNSIGKESKENKLKITNICKTCNKSYEKCGNMKGKYFCSDECYRKSLQKFDITPEELSKLVWEMPTTKIAEIYNVSDVAISKRCKKYGIKKPPRGYWMKK
ncbi:HNH homing endonuclease [Salmonella phage SE_PL]|nr:hypothetical protein 7t3_043 [Salmonella phage 7t3]QIG63120.1 HNH homing endonuclease [Salmonella phage SE_PL]